MSIAWYIQRIISAFTSAIKGDKFDVVIALYTNSQPINFRLYVHKVESWCLVELWTIVWKKVFRWHFVLECSLFLILFEIFLQSICGQVTI